METQQSHIGDEGHTVAHIREQHTTQLQEAVTRFVPSLYRRACRYVGNPHDAEDAVQDALLSAYKHLDQFKGTAKMTTWLTTIVTNSALTKLRGKSRHSHISLDEGIGHEHDLCASDILADIRPNPEGEYISSDLRRHLRQAAAALSPSLRRVIQMRDLDGLTTSEVARILGVPEGTVKSQVSRARSKLKKLVRGLRKRV